VRYLTAAPGMDRPPIPAAAPQIAAAPPERASAVLSAEAPALVGLGAVELVDVKVELAAAARPLAEAITAAIDRGVKIRVLLTLDGGTLEAEGPRVLDVDPPKPGAPARSAFAVRGVRAGGAQIGLLFRQGASELGAIRLAARVTEAIPPAGVPISASTLSAATPSAADADVLTILVDQVTDGAALRYRFRLLSAALGLNYFEAVSNPLQDRGGGLVRTQQDYVRSIHESMTRTVRDVTDAQNLQRDVRAWGMDLARQLIPDSIARLMWEGRDKIRAIKLVSWEAYIPWEMLRLAGADRSWAEHGLVRSLVGRMGSRRLALDDWSYYIAEYPQGSERPIGGEADYFKITLPGRGVAAQPIPPREEDFFRALEQPSYDVLHIACHGRASPGDIERSLLVIGDEMCMGEVRAMQVEAVTVGGSARLEPRRPLVFLNACESSRQGASLTALGGWPRVFMDRGAGAFVGTAWPVRDKPAAAFAEAFYDALQSKLTLAEAAALGRREAQKSPDASWLAYEIYGEPDAAAP
jgi:hypothetical protein